MSFKSEQLYPENPKENIKQEKFLPGEVARATNLTLQKSQEYSLLHDSFYV